MWDGDGPWGPRGQAPKLGKLISPVNSKADPTLAPKGGWTESEPPPPENTLAWGDFDGDGVANWRDNCLLVGNRDQQPASLPAGTANIGPDDMVALADKWKAQNPSAVLLDRRRGR